MTCCERLSPPARWLTDNEDLLPASGAALDVACGCGRHAFWLAARGYEVQAVDRNEEAVEFVNAESHRLGLNIRARLLDLETPSVDLGRDRFELIAVVHYLFRGLVPQMIAALRPGGVLVYETFTRAQAARGKPTNPDFLLEAGELRRLVAPLRIVREREGDYDGRFVASVVAARHR